MKEEIEKTLNVLRKGGVILYPTDTIWGIGCDAENQKAVDKIYKIKKRVEGKSLLVLVDSIEKIARYVKKTDPVIIDLVLGYNKPLTVIYPGAVNVAKGVSAPDKTIGIRVVRDDFCKTLINEFGRAIVSTSANISGEPSPVVYHQISEEITNAVDYAVNLNRSVIASMRPSRIIRVLPNGGFEVVRE